MARVATRRAAIFAAALGCALAGGCAIRYDGSGITRVGVGLWGLGDPPGVDWNLDALGREVPELPRSAPAELPPRAPSGPGSPFVDERMLPVGHAAAIDDNRDCGLRCDLRPPSAALAAGPRAGGRAADR